MKTLFIAPLPPPIDGHSLASRMALQALAEGHDVTVVNFAKESARSLLGTLGRAGKVLSLLRDVGKHEGNADRIYLTISESLAGNAKDLLIYLLCRSKPERMFIHLHGGSIGRLLWERRPMLYRVNKRLLKRVGGVIISGESHRSIFADFISPDRIHILPNAVGDELFAAEAEIRTKFAADGPLRILYVSHMSPDKGCTDLLDAVESLPEAVRARIRVDFAGRFDSEQYRLHVLPRINALAETHYHGVVSEAEKIRLFREAHVFCLPTRMFEGQPISILEAYASGCVVCATGQPGIRDIFVEGVNGVGIVERSPSSLRTAIETLLKARCGLLQTALANSALAASRFRASIYGEAFRRIIETDPGTLAADVTSPLTSDIDR